MGEAGRALGSEDVDDLIQEVFLRLLTTGALGRLDTASNPLPYLARAARNLAIDELRRRRREQLGLLPGDSAAAAPELPEPPELPELNALTGARQGTREHREASLERLGVYVAGLPAELAVIYHARFVLGLSQRETASGLALSRRRVRTLDDRLLAGAASCLGESSERSRAAAQAGAQVSRACRRAPCRGVEQR